MLVREIALAETWQLRQRVLRPGQPLAAVQLPEDELPAVFHLGLFANEELRGVASFYQQPGPVALQNCVAAGVVPEVPLEQQWRLRQMAVASEVQGRGYGGALLNAGAQLAGERGGGLLWFNARTLARGFYERHGYCVLGREFDQPGLGPHYLMWGMLVVQTA